MAGDWIKMRVALTYDLKVMQIARTLNGDSGFLNAFAPDCQLPLGGCNAQALHTFVIGALHRFWCAAQEVTSDGNLRKLEAHDIDCLVGCVGFCDALIEVGWLETSADGQLQVHNWPEHNGDSAKKRATSQKRVLKHRDVKRASVATAQRKSVTREEKRREENKGEGVPSPSPDKPAVVITEPRSRDLLFDAIAQVTGADPAGNGPRIGKIKKALMAAKPPYTPDEVLCVPEVVSRFFSVDFAITLNNFTTYNGWVRTPPANTAAARAQAGGMFSGIKEFLDRQEAADGAG